MDSAQGRIHEEMGQAFDQIEQGLAQIGEALQQLRGLTPRVTALEAVLSDLEMALARARGGSPPAVAESAAPVAAVTETAVEEPPAPVVEPASASALVEEVAPGEAQPAVDDGRRCYLLNVESIGSALDLRTVDQPIAENPQVLDVALLDYDGRRATLKVWLNADGDPSVVRDELESRLRASGDWCVISLSEQVAA